MTLALKQGPENVLDALKYYLAGELPSDISTANATTSATLTAYLKGPYTYDGSKIISITRNNASSPCEFEPGAQAYTPDALATAINDQWSGDGEGNCNSEIIATTAMNGNYLQLYSLARGTVGSLKAEDTTGNAVLGWNGGFTDNYYPLRDFAEIEIQYENIEPLAYPAIHLRCDAINEEIGFPQMRAYSVNMRVFEVSPLPPPANVLGVQLARYTRIIANLLLPASGSRSLNDQVNAIQLANIAPLRLIETDSGAQYRAYVDFSLEVQVQED